MRAQAGLLLGERENGEQSVLCASPSAQGVFSAVFIRINGSLFIDIFAAVWNLSSHVWRILAQPCRGGARGAAWERDDAVCLRQGRFGRARPVLVGKANFSPRVSVPVSGVRKTECRVICRSPATQARQRLSASRPKRTATKHVRPLRVGQVRATPTRQHWRSALPPLPACKLRFPATQARRLLRVSRLAAVRTSDSSEPQQSAPAPCSWGRRAPLLRGSAGGRHCRPTGR